MSEQKRKKNIALFVAMLENEFSIAVLEGAVKGAEEIGANLFVFPSGFIDGAYRHKKHNKFRYQYNVLNSFLKSNSIDAAIIEYGTITSALDEKKKREYLSQIGDIPVVLLSESAEGFPSVCINNKTGLEEVIQHLIDEHHCRHIGFVSGPKNNQDAQERLNVYKKVMTDNKLRCTDDWITYGNFSIYVEEAVMDIMVAHPETEAIVFANDHMAIGAMDVLRSMKYEPGKDILITGFDNIPSSVLSEPALTTVMADPRQLSYNAVLAIDGQIQIGEVMNVPSHMVIRESCGCPLHRSVSSELDMQTQNSAEYIRNATREKVLEAEKRKRFEVELGNINREMLSLRDSEEEWFVSVLEITRKLKLGNSYILLYEEGVKHDDTKPWIQPKKIDLRGYCKNDKTVILGKGECTYNIDDIFNEEFLKNDCRMNMLITPLFFRGNQYGFLLVENDIDYFQFAYQMASQISTTLEIVNILNAQDKIKKEFEYANQSKSNFLANMSHEIRTPINAILGMNEMILRENKVPEIDGYAMNVKNAANALLSLVNDILDFSKIEAGKMSIIPVEYELSRLINDSINLMIMRAKEKNLELNVECDNSLPSVLLGDDVRIRQIILNILSNAIKYTEKGKVTLCVSGSVKGNYADITFKVTDTGIGIKQEDLVHLFEKFQRIDEKRNRNIEGTGLGMSITIGLLKLMGSSLDVDSVYGKGSKFSFTLHQKVIDASPIKVKEDDSATEKKTEFKQKYIAPDAKVLVVDDIDINRVIISSLLSQTQIQIDEADGGKSCLELVKENKYDLILLDHMMPDMDGLETIREIRQLPGCDYESLPVIALTANAIAGSDKIYSDAGFNDYITKPVDPEILDSAIVKFLENKIVKV